MCYFCYTICSKFIIPNILFFAMPFVPLSFIV